MALRRGVGIVLGLIIAAILVSATGLILMAAIVGRQPQVAGNSTLVLRIGGDLQEMEPGGVIGQFFEAPPTVRVARRGAAQGESRSRGSQRHHPALRRGRALGQGPGGPRRDHRLQELRQADRRLSRIRRRAGVLPRERLRQGVPDADGVARPDRHGELRAVPARHARQDRRVPRHAAHRPLQDRVEHLHREHLHAGASRDGGSLNADMYEQLIRGLADGRHKIGDGGPALVDHGPFLPEDAFRAGLVDDVAYEDELDDKVKLANGTAKFVDRGRLPPHIADFARAQSRAADRGHLRRRA